MTNESAFKRAHPLCISAWSTSARSSSIPTACRSLREPLLQTWPPSPSVHTHRYYETVLSLDDHGRPTLAKSSALEAQGQTSKAMLEQGLEPVSTLHRRATPPPLTDTYRTYKSYRAHAKPYSIANQIAYQLTLTLTVTLTLAPTKDLAPAPSPSYPPTSPLRVSPFAHDLYISWVSPRPTLLPDSRGSTSLAQYIHLPFITL